MATAPTVQFHQLGGVYLFENHLGCSVVTGAAHLKRRSNVSTSSLVFRSSASVVVLWLLAAVVLIGLSRAAGSEFNATLSLPNTDSQAAVSLLAQNFPAAAGEGDQVVIQAGRGETIHSPSVQSAVTAALARVANVPGVASVVSPYASDGSRQIGRDGTVAFATVNWNIQPANITTTDAEHVITAAESGDGTHVHVSLEGQSISNTERPTLGASVVVGIIAALIILLIVFGRALFGITASARRNSYRAGDRALTGPAATHAFDVASQSIDLAVLIGLGVGVDCGTVHRQSPSQRRHGRSLLSPSRRRSSRYLRSHGALRRSHRLYCAPRAVRSRGRLPLRPVGCCSHCGGSHYGEFADLLTRSTRIPGTQSPFSQRDGRPSKPAS